MLRAMVPVEDAVRKKYISNKNHPGKERAAIRQDAKADRKKSIHIIDDYRSAHEKYGCEKNVPQLPLHGLAVFSGKCQFKRPKSKK